MTIAGTWGLATFEGDSVVVDGKVKIIPFPRSEDPQVTETVLQAGPYEYFAVNPDCAHPQEAVEFAVFMSQKISDYCYQNGLGLPVWDTEGQTSSELFQQALDEAATATRFMSGWDFYFDSDVTVDYMNLVLCCCSTRPRQKILPSSCSRQIRNNAGLYKSQRKRVKRGAIMKKIFSDKRAIVIFLLPAALVYAIFAIYPVIMSGYYSLLDWNGVGDAKFIGLSNYVKLFVGNNDGFGSALLNSFILAFLSVFVQLTLSLVLALAITYPKVKKQERFYRTVYFLPAIVSTVIIAELWKKIYHPSYGLLNGFLGMLGLESWQRGWWAIPKPH